MLECFFYIKESKGYLMWVENVGAVLMSLLN